MNRRTHVTLAGLSAVAVAAALLVGSPAHAADAGAPTPTVVVHGLNNPRQLALTPFGLLVAEAGKGGDQCVTVPGGETSTTTCIGYTGSVTWVPAPGYTRNAAPHRILTGLLSNANPQGGFATGSQGVAARGFEDIYVAVTDKPKVALPATIDTTGYGKLLRSRFLSKPQPLADLSGYESAEDPDKQGPESNPYAVLALPGRVLVADAAANDILQYRDGHLGTFAVLPNVQDGICAGLPNDNGTVGCDPVPTGLAVDRDGSIYVSGLGNLGPGSGRVYKLDSRTGRIVAVWDNLTGVTGVAVDRHGNVYASQLFAGKVTRIAPDGTRSDLNVPFPAGLAVCGDSLYVAAYSVAPETGLGVPNVDSSGQVWRFAI